MYTCPKCHHKFKAKFNCTDKIDYDELYQNSVKRSRDYYIRKIASKNYNPNLSDLENWIKAEQEFDNPDFFNLNRLGYRYWNEGDCDKIIIDNNTEYYFQFNHYELFFGYNKIYPGDLDTEYSEQTNKSLFDTCDMNPMPLEYIGYKLESIIKFINKHNLTVPEPQTELKVMNVFLSFLNDKHTRPIYYKNLKKIDKYKNTDLKIFDTMKLKKLYNLMIKEMFDDINNFINDPKNKKKIDITYKDILSHYNYDVKHYNNSFCPQRMFDFIKDLK